MTVLFTADIHLSDNPRDAYRDHWMSGLPELAKREGCSHVVLGGDLTEQKDRHSAWLTNRIPYHVSRLVKAGLSVTIYTGNHDYIDEGVPFFEFLKRMDGVSYAKAVTVAEIDDLGQVLILPHTRNPQRDWHGVDVHRYSYVFAHATFKGAQSDSGFQFDDGVDPGLFGDQRVIAGDIHTPQRVGPVRYVGAPYTIDFGDSYHPRVFVLSRSKIKSVSCRGPQKVLVTVKSVKELTHSAGVQEGDIVKVDYAAKYQRDRWQEIVDACGEWAERRKVTLHSVRPCVERDARDTPIVKVRGNAATDDKQVLKAFGLRHRVEARTMKTGQFLIDRSES